MSSGSAPLTKLCETCGFRLEATLFRCPSDGAPLSRESPKVAMLGPYRLLERLGRGGMGVVYRATHTKLGRTVAIKMLHRSLVADKTTLARFFQEARSVNTIRHPNVVEVYDFVTSGSDVYMVMEFLVGCDLHTAIERDVDAPISLPRAVFILQQVCAALQAAHAANIIHRDLKPANIFLVQHKDGDDFVKLLDFGLAKRARGDGKMTKDGVVLGTVEYMAPEQARGDKLDGRVDIYAVGCIAYEMLTGRRVFAGGNAADLMLRHVRERPVPLRALIPALPPALDELVMSCLAKRREHRPPTAAALAEALLEIVPIAEPGFLPGAHRPPVGAAAPPTLSPIVRASLHGQPAARRIPGRQIVLGSVAVGVALLGLFVWVQVALRHHQAEPLPPLVAPAAVAAVAPISVTLDSTPRGAEIWKEGSTKIGVTPHSLLVAPGSSHRLRFVRAGYEAVERVFHVNASTTIAVTLRASAGEGADAERALPAPSIAPAVEPRARTEPKRSPRSNGRTRTMNPFRS